MNNKEASTAGIKWVVQEIWCLVPMKGKIRSRNNNTVLNELCPQFHMRLVNTKACWWKTLSCSQWQRQSACVWRMRVKGTGDDREGDQGGNLNFTCSMSLKTLISVSGRLTGDPSSCQKNFILFSKEFKASFPDFLLQFQLDLNTINRKV